jgi:hypothetical protein
MGLFGAVAIGAFFAAGSVTMLLLTGVALLGFRGVERRERVAVVWGF